MADLQDLLNKKDDLIAQLQNEIAQNKIESHRQLKEAYDEAGAMRKEIEEVQD